MKERKPWFAVAVTVLGIAVNMGGKALAARLVLPLWLDSFGTVLAAYLLGPVCGAAVGLSGNLCYAALMGTSPFYGLTSLAIGLLVGLSVRRRRLDSLFGSMVVASLVTLASVLISTPLNLLLYGERTGNLWGDSVVAYLMEHRVARIPSCIAGEFYLDFLDKVLTILVFSAAIRLAKRVLRGRKKERKPERAAPALLALLAFSLTLSAAAPAKAAREPERPDFYSYVQTVYSSDNGLPCGEANDIAQTRDGVLWIGTYAGLYRCSGSEFERMNDFSSVKNVNCLYVDGEGRLWIGTNDSGLTVCIGENVSYVLNTDSGLPSDSVRSIVRSADGLYYVGTSDTMQVLGLDGGLHILDELDEVVYAQSLSADETGYAAAATYSGDLFLLREGRVLQRLRPEGQESFTCCLFGQDGLLYAGTSGNEARVYALEEDGSLRLQDALCFEGLSHLNCLFRTEEGLLFACSDTGVGCIGPEGEHTLIHTGQFRYSVTHMLMDYQGNYWFTSTRQGALRMARSSFSNLYATANMESGVVNSVTKWRDKLYIGTDDGLDILDTAAGRGLDDGLTEALQQLRIRCVSPDRRGRLWVSTYGRGLWEVAEDGTWTVHDAASGFCDWVRMSLELSDGTVAAAGDAGIGWFREGEMERLLPYGPGLSSAMVLCMLETEGGVLLAGTDGDGIVALKDGECAARITARDGLSSGVILRIAPTASGSGYYVVTSNGLCHMDADLRVTLLENFPYSNNYDVWTLGEERVFILSSAGVFVADENRLLGGEEDPTQELLDSRRGLPYNLTANSWNYRDENDLLYLSTSAGVFSLDMRDYGASRHSYRMRLRAARLDGAEVPVERGSPIAVGRDTARVELFPELISYSLEDPYVSIRLLGFEAEETVVRRSELGSVVYTNLPSGSYTLRMAVLDNDRNVLEESSYRIEKELEFYDNWWFRIYLLGVAALAVAWLSWFITRTQIQRTLNFQKKELEFARLQLEMGNETILAIARTVDAKDVNTSQHSQRVSEYSVLIGRELGLPEEECENLRKAALLHDIGKIGIPDRVLNKPDKLTDEEYALMKSHVIKGADILKDFTMVDHVVEGALYHHERYDGRGYASGLQGENIPLYGRIIGVADAFDAMAQNRVYRKGLDIGFVLGELERCKGSQFDPKITDILIRLVNEGRIDPVASRPAAGGTA